MQRFILHYPSGHEAKSEVEQEEYDNWVENDAIRILKMQHHTPVIEFV